MPDPKPRKAPVAAEPDEAPKRARRSAGAVTANGYRTRSYYLLDDLHLRLKAAWYGTRELPDGAPAFTSLVSRIFELEAERLEQLHNDGERFPPAPENARGSRRSAADTPEGYRPRSYYLLDDLHLRLKAAWYGTKDLPGGGATFTALVSRIFETEAERLEQLHNDGERFPPAPANARGVDPDAARRQGHYMEEVWAGRRPMS